MKPSELYQDFNSRESPYMPTLITKTPALLQPKVLEDSSFKDLLDVYLKLKKKRQLAERSERKPFKISEEQQRIKSPQKTASRTHRKLSVDPRDQSLKIAGESFTNSPHVRLTLKLAQTHRSQSQANALLTQARQIAWTYGQSERNEDTQITMETAYLDDILSAQKSSYSRANKLEPFCFGPVRTQVYSILPMAKSKYDSFDMGYQLPTVAQSMQNIPKPAKKATTQKKSPVARQIQKKEEIELKRQEVLILKRRRFNSNGGQRQYAVKFLQFGKQWKDLTNNNDFPMKLQAAISQRYMEKQFRQMYENPEGEIL